MHGKMELKNVQKKVSGLVAPRPNLGVDSSEWYQALIRLGLVGVVGGYSFLFDHTDFEPNLNVVSITSVYFLLSTINLGSFFLYPRKSHIRRSGMLFADVLVASLVAHVGGEDVAPFFAVFIWIILGHGMRYGESYVVLGAALGACGFSWMLLSTPYWQANPKAGIGLLVAVLVIPVFAYSLVRQIREARQQALDANESKTRFATELSHDIRTGLASISSLSDLLSREHFDKASEEKILLIRSAADTLLSVAGDILDMAAMERGSFRASRDEVVVPETSHGVLDTIRPFATKKGISIGLVIHLDVPMRVWGDKARLTQILLNLVANAVKYTRQGHVRLTVSRKDIGLRFEVDDSGVGLPSDMEPDAAFERYVQGNAAADGIGLGLSIVRGLVEELGGRVAYARNEPTGSRFWVELPADPIVAPNDEAGEVRVVVVGKSPEGVDRLPWMKPASTWLAFDDVDANLVSERLPFLVFDPAVLSSWMVDSSALAIDFDNCIGIVEVGAKWSPELDSMTKVGSWGVSSSLVSDDGRVFSLLEILSRVRGVALEQPGAVRQTRVLVVDDDPISELFLKLVLEELGCHVDSVQDGLKAVESAYHSPPDLLITDNQLPGLDGIDVVRRLRDTTIPIVVISADATDSAVRSHLDAGAAEYIVKPATPEALLELLRKFTSYED